MRILRLRAYYDPDGDLILPASVGYARFERRCDKLGNVLVQYVYRFHDVTAFRFIVSKKIKSSF